VVHATQEEEEEEEEGLLPGMPAPRDYDSRRGQQVWPVAITFLGTQPIQVLEQVMVVICDDPQPPD